MGSISTVLVPLSYSSSCSGSECTWISPGASAVTSSSIGCPCWTSTRSPFGVTESPSKVTSMTCGPSLDWVLDPEPEGDDESSPPQAAVAPRVSVRTASVARTRRIGEILTCR